MAIPVLLDGDLHLRWQLGDLSKPNSRAFAGGAVCDRARQRVDISGRAVVDDGDPSHAIDRTAC
jgi:hypothetical protein